MQSPEQPTRRLAAILFGDIAGYTLMMQQDESKALTRLAHYQQVLKVAIEDFDGEIVKNYGDGSLCLFSSVLDAVRCAQRLQEELTQEPIVPLRIGLHIGDVTYRDGDVYGDAINLASRIESFGIPGSILLSKDVYEKVKNQADFSFDELGTFTFKNVDQNIEIYAFANEGFPVPAAVAICLFV